MGYYTDFTFGGGVDQDVMDFIGGLSGYGADRNNYDDIKWYDHHQHMIAASLRFPDKLLQLDGVGEEYGDIWRKFYKNGKFVRAEAKIVFSEPDLSALD